MTTKRTPPSGPAEPDWEAALALATQRALAAEERLARLVVALEHGLDTQDPETLGGFVAGFVAAYRATVNQTEEEKTL